MVDLPADTTTPAVIAPGESLDDRIEVARDRDWVRLDLTEGQIVRISVTGIGPDAADDTRLWLHGPGGRVLEFNDDYGDGYDPELIFLAPRAASYFIEIGGYDRSITGDYRLSVSETSMPDDLRPALDWGTQQADAEVTYHFATDGQRFDGYTSEGFNAYEKARFLAAFALIEQVCNLTFTEAAAAAGADFRLVLDLNEVDGEFLGYFNPPGERRAGVGVFDGAAWDRAEGGSLEAGGYDFVTIVHEVLHGLGLAHPHDSGGGSDIFPGVSSEDGDFGYFDLNQGIFTTMSYNTGFPGDEDSQGDEDNLWGYEFGPMALDIAVLQQKYGANMTTATGDDTYLLPRTNGPGTFWQAIWDAGGTDAIRHAGRAAAVIDLRAATLAAEAGGGGFVSSVAGIAGGLTIAAGVVIENALGGLGRDSITGNDAANRLTGRAGADSLAGGAGEDDLSGGRGGDVLAGGAGGDNLAGGAGGDTFVFTAGDSDAADGDWIADFAGRDVIDLTAFGALEFIGTDAFGAQGTGELRYALEGSEAVVAVDSDGDGAAELVFRMGNIVSLTEAQFLLG